jgi:Transposase DDE domain group 1
MARVSAIACGHKDAIDLDRLRHDPLMKVAVGRCPATGAPLALQSTISRLENAPSKTEAARLAAALVDQAGTTVKPGKQESLDIDDTFCAAHGAQQLAFWNAHHDERGFASMHIHVASGTPVVAILRPARTPKGTEVRTVIKHVTKRLRRHWRNTRIVWRGDSHYGRVEAMEWAENHDADYIFGLAGNSALDALVAETAVNLRCHHAMSSTAKLRTFASFMYQANSWKRPRKVVARLECSLQPVAGETGMRQEVDIRYVVTSLKGSARHLYENVYCQRGQMENLIKLHKAQLASDRMSCHSATANQVRLVLHTAAFWLMHGVRAAIPRTNSLAGGEFATIRERLIKIGARVIEHIARIRIQLPTSCPERALFRTVALRLLPSGP